MFRLSLMVIRYGSWPKDQDPAAAELSFRQRSVLEHGYLDGVCCKAGTAQQQKESAEVILTSV